MAERTVVKAVKNAKLYSDGTIAISMVRASYPHVDKKWCKNKEKDTPAYSITGILANDTHEEAIALCVEVADKLAKDAKITVKKDAKFIRDGENEAKPEYADAWIVAARETQRPAVLNPDRTEMEQDDIAETFVPGHFIDMLIQPWVQDNEHGKRVNASLRGVRYRKEGPQIGEGGMDAETVASSFGDDDDDDGGFAGDGDDENGGL